jgi:glycerol-3-phosphate dehydrogenase
MGLLITIVMISIFIGGFILIAKITAKEDDTPKTNFQVEAIKQIIPDDFNYDQIHYTMGPGISQFIGLDERNQRFVVATKSKYSFINFSEILESEIIQDDVSISKTSRSSQIGGAIVGGMLAGGVGAIVGGLGGKSTSSTEVKKLTLKIVVDSLSQPVVNMPFFSEVMPLSKEHKRVVKAIEDINHWHSIVSVIINRNNKASQEG